MKDLLDLKDLTIHDVAPASEREGDNLKVVTVHLENEKAKARIWP